MWGICAASANHYDSASHPCANILSHSAGDTIQTKSAIGVLLAQRLRAEFKEPIGIIQVTLAALADKTLR